MDCQEPFRKKRNFRIFYGRATLFASESLQFGGTSAYVPSPSVGNRHNGGVNIVLCDGHVEHFKQNELIQPYNGKWMYRYFYDDNPSY